MNLSLLKNWWWLTINGIAAIIFGGLAILYPVKTLVLLLGYFGLLALFLGAFFLLGGYLNRRETKLWDFWVFEGVLNASIGLILLFYNDVTLPVFMVLLSLWAILIGAIQIITVLRLWSAVPHKTLYLVNGLIALIFGILMIINPFNGINALSIFIGIYTIILGFFSIVISIRMKHVKSTDIHNQTSVYTYHHD
jgi:uncharacterized membrane protein HdeD (DUF308 family)